MSFRNTILLFSFSIVTAVFVFQSDIGREPASEENFLRVGIYNLSQNNKIVLIGIDNEGLHRGPWAMDAEAHGFEGVGQPVTHIDPRFLIMLNEAGVYSIHAFDMGKTSLSKISEEGDYRQKLPPGLLKAEKIRKQLLFKKPVGIFGILENIITFLPKGTAKFVWNLFTKGKENNRSKQAAYLSHIIEKALYDKQFPDLIEALGQDNLEEMGALLAIRYHKKGILGGILARNESLKPPTFSR